MDWLLVKGGQTVIYLTEFDIGIGEADVRFPLTLGSLYHMTEERIFLLYISMNYREFSVKSKLIISLFQTVK